MEKIELGLKKFYKLEWDYPYSDEGIWGAASNGDLDRLKKKLMGMGHFHLKRNSV